MKDTPPPRATPDALADLRTVPLAELGAAGRDDLAPLVARIAGADGGARTVPVAAFNSAI